LVGLTAWAAATAIAVPCMADEPVRPVQYDPKAYPSPSARGSLLLVGAATTAAWYSLALSSALIWPGAAGAEDLKIPVAGPFMALADSGCDDDNPDCSLVWPVFRAILIAIDGIGQAGGVAVMGEAALLPTREAGETAEDRSIARKPDRASLQWRPVPFLTGKSGIGLGVVGRF
jgi:hypothetical protein